MKILKNLLVERFFAFVISALVGIYNIPFGSFAQDNVVTDDQNPPISTIDDITTDEQDIFLSKRENSYANYLKKYGGYEKPQNQIKITYDKIFPAKNAKIEFSKSEKIDGENAFFWKSQTGEIFFDVDIPKSGIYNMEFMYYCPAVNTNNVELSLEIDGKAPYDTASRIVLSKVWINSPDDLSTNGENIAQDKKQNDIRPAQVEKPLWQVKTLKDTDGLSNQPLIFYLEQGKHRINIKSDKAQFAINYIKFYNQKPPEKYVAPSKDDIAKTSGQKIILEGELADYKSDRSLFPTSDAHNYITSSSNGASPTKTRYNTIGGGSNWSQATQSASWEFDIEQEGYYKIGIRARQNQMRGMYSNRRILINGEVQSEPLNQVKFYYNENWSVTSPKDQNNQMVYVYLKKGKNTITLEAIPGEIGEIMNNLDNLTYEINSYYRQIRQVTGPIPDENNNYRIDKVVPTIVDDFKSYSKQLREYQKQIEQLSESGGSEAVTLDKMAIILDKCTAKTDRIPNLMNQIKDNITSLSSWVATYRQQPLELDRIEICSSDLDFTDCNKKFLKSLSFGFKGFIGSFFEDYNSLSDFDQNTETMTCWITLGRDNANVVKQIVDSEYNPTAKTKIAIKLVQSGMVEATFAGQGPDIALFLGGDFPIQLAARDVLVNLEDMNGFKDTLSRFSKDATVLYKYNGGTYGLPVSQTFPMLFYRTDVLKELGIDPQKDLQTWQGLIDVLPTLQRKYMEVGLILPIATINGGTTVISTTTEAGNTFATLLLQSGINYYNDEQTKTTFDSQTAVDAFKMWTEFYTKYSFEQKYDAFTRFRQGDMPIVIQNYTFYNQLAVAAPEIKDCWDFMQMPGTVQADGSISHASNSQGSGAVIYKKAADVEQAWDFINWFTSTPVQIEYANQIESVLGTMGRFDTANIEALKHLSWTTSETEKLVGQLKQQVEIPIIPASYAVTRDVMNAFRETVNNAKNPRDTLYWYNKEINKEIERKLENIQNNK